jgi:rhamnosyl/mannosyltransferase
MEHFLWDLLQAQRAAGIAAAALVHHERPGWHRVRPGVDDPLPIYRAPCLGRLLYVPVAPSFVLWLETAIRELAPSILHLHMPNSSALMALMLPSARRLPWVVHWHADLVASRLDRRLALAYRLYRPLEQRLLSRSAAVIATSPPYLDASEALEPWRERCTTIPLGLDPRRLATPTTTELAAAEQRWRLGRSAGRLRVLAIGRLTYYKGHEVLLRAISELPDAQALIVGTGEREPRLRQLIGELGLGDRGRLVGACSDAEVAALLATCDLLCLPSLERTEAFGLVLLEAMHFAKPVVVSAIPGSGAGWVVEQAENGCLVPPGDPQVLAEVLKRLAAEPKERARLGRNGQDALSRRFGIGPVAEAITDVYTGVLDSGTTARAAVQLDPNAR